ncbi:RpiB/LacA/LacB family sugar-phosphate isomerase [Candidatus Saccharibacteria bacterium]|nr:MAG: RpiB/LacA/LacB family sugar-phosphate isomerase [Candidatus Saccharibacteria bacterium]
MKIYLGSDHNGFHLKEKIFAYLSKRDYNVEDVGDEVLDPNDDFPEFAFKAAVKILGSEEDDTRAILLCGGGQGMSMAANRIRGIRAAVIWDAYEAKMTRNDNDSNVLCLPSRILDQEDDKQWQDIIDTWLRTPFANAPRYVRRNKQLDELA